MEHVLLVFRTCNFAVMIFIFFTSSFSTNLFQFLIGIIIYKPKQKITTTTTSTKLKDVLQSEDAPNKFFFYEVYQDADAIAHHKTQPHYLAWGDFKESGGTVSSVSKKASGKFMTWSDWAVKRIGGMGALDWIWHPKRRLYMGSWLHDVADLALNFEKYRLKLNYYRYQINRYATHDWYNVSVLQLYPLLFKLKNFTLETWCLFRQFL